jgi:hypothetical protein
VSGQCHTLVTLPLGKQLPLNRSSCGPRGRPARLRVEANSLSLPGFYQWKTMGGGKGPLFLNVGTRWCERSNSLPSPLCPRERILRTHYREGWGRFQSQYWRSENPWPLSEFELRIFAPLASHCTDQGINTHRKNEISEEKFQKLEKSVSWKIYRSGLEESKSRLKDKFSCSRHEGTLGA